MKRWPYFFSILGINLVLAIAQDSPEIYLVLFFLVVIAWVWLTTFRCEDIGINKAWAIAVLIPLAPLYFFFAPHNFHKDKAL
jgi:hypothetical protein